LKEKKQGKSIKKKGLRVLLYGAATLLLVLLISVLLLNSHRVQTYLAQQATEWLTEKTGDSVTVEGIGIRFFKGVEIKQLRLLDHHGTPMIYVNRMFVSPEFFRLFSKKMRIHKAEFDSVDFRLIRYPNTDNYAFLLFIKKLSSSDTTTSQKPFQLKINHIKIAHLHFQLRNEVNPSPDTSGNTMNYDNIRVTDGTLAAHNFYVAGDSVGFRLDNLSAREKSGLILRRMKSDVVISGRHFAFTNTHLETNHSRLNMDYSMNATGWDAYSDYIDSVKMQGTFRNCHLDMSDIGYFAPIMFQMKNHVIIDKGYVKGPVSNLKGENLAVSYGGATTFHGNVTMKGLPDFYSTQINAEIQNFSTSVDDLHSFLIPQSHPHIPIPDDVNPSAVFHIAGAFKGSYYRFATQLQLKSAKKDSGMLQLSLRLHADANQLYQLHGVLAASHFPLDKLFSKEYPLGTASFKASLQISDTSGNKYARMHFDASRFALNGYSYQNIHYTGHSRSDTLWSDFRIKDPHLSFALTGITRWHKKPRFTFHLMLHQADFYPLHLWTQQDFHLKGEADIRFTGLHPDSLSGIIQMKNTVVGLGKDRYPVRLARFEKYRNKNREQVMRFQSDLLDLQVTGQYHPSTFIPASQQLINHYFPFLPASENHRKSQDALRITLLLKKPEFLGEHFIYGLNISPNTLITAYFDMKKHELTASGYARKLLYQGTQSLYNHLEVRTTGGKLQTTFQTQHLILRDSTATDKTVFGIDSLRLRLGARNDSLAFHLFWHNPDTLWINKGLVKGLYVDNSTRKQFSILQSDIYVNDTLWKVAPNNAIVYTHNSWNFKNLVIHGGLSEISLQGKYPKNDGDSLGISFRKWNLSNLDLLWNMLGFDIDGTLNGDVKIIRTNGYNARMADLTIDSLALNHTSLGNAHILSTWNNTDNSAFIKAQVIRKDTAKRLKTIDVTGFYYPYRDTASLDLAFDFTGLKLKAINPFFNEYISHLQGTASGKMTLKGSVKDPFIQGYVDVKHASLLVNYLNTKYAFQQRVYFDKDKIDLGKLTLYDTLGNSAVLQGEVLHHYFRDMRLNLEINTNKLLFFNTTRHMNNIYYGTAIASGKVRITGPANNIKLEVDARTDRGTSVILPLDYSTEVADKDYIIFKPPPVDSSLLKPQETVLKLSEGQKSKYSIALHLDVNRNANLKIYLPSNMGNIESNGNGQLNLAVNSEGDMRLSGDYIVDKGEFNFSLGSFVKKHFELVKGGRISWAGDPYQATVSLKGLYKLKSNLSSLGIVMDSTAQYKNRTQVNCYMIMSHDLFNPDIRFRITFPDLDPDMQRRAYAQLDTTNEAVMNQQMISLLVLGSFSLSNASNISWNTSYYTILSNQLSSMLSKISKDFDIGLNYKPGDALTQQEFDVALSTQLFDDRLIINGNFGMTYDKQNKSANNIVGDVDIRYKLTKDGRWMLIAYNHSNVNSWYYYSNYDKVSPYTQGVGIAYQKDFNRLADIFRKRKSTQKPKKHPSKKAKR
jgi:hypothetical protein